MYIHIFWARDLDLWPMTLTYELDLDIFLLDLPAKFKSVCLSVRLGLLRAHYTPLQRYMGYLCTSRAQYAPPKRNMHHVAKGRLYFLKNSGDPYDFLFWWFTENIHKFCVSGKCLCGSDWHILKKLLGSHVFEWVTWLIYRFTSIWTGHTVTIIFGFTKNFCTYM